MKLSKWLLVLLIGMISLTSFAETTDDTKTKHDIVMDVGNDTITNQNISEFEFSKQYSINEVGRDLAKVINSKNDIQYISYKDPFIYKHPTFRYNLFYCYTLSDITQNLILQRDKVDKTPRKFISKARDKLVI